jgi:pimeloyl-ACP methyl ester carboxylesterase
VNPRVVRYSLALAVLAVVFFAAACGSWGTVALPALLDADGGSPPPVEDAAPPDASEASDAGVAAPDATAPGCNPVIGDDCLTPFPSAFFEQPDTTSATGVRVHMAPGMLPVQTSGTPIWPDRLNQKDGFSPATSFVVYFASGVDPKPLGTWIDPSASLTPTGPVQILDMANGERVIAFAELDHDDLGSGRQGLLVHPLQRLTPGHRYAIALVGLSDASGAPLAPAPFRALRDGTPLSSTLAPVAASYDTIFSVLTAAGIDRASLSLAWDVVIASDAMATSHLVSMRDTALGMIDGGALGYAIPEGGAPTTDPNLHAQVEATIDVPLFLQDGGPTSTMSFDDAGAPAMNGTTTANVTIDVPKCAETATSPLPVVVFGHGLFGNAKDTMSNGTLTKLANEWCYLLIGTDWIGLSSADYANLPGAIATDLNNVYIITDRLQQAHVNAQTMTRLFMTTMKNDPALQIDGHAITDASQLYYFGVSNGGIQGTTFMALQPDIVRGTLNVPGGKWSMLIPRSCDFDTFFVLLYSALRDGVDRQVALAVSQSEWDHADAMTFAPHLLKSPLPGVPAKHILVQESLGDAQVANVATRILARTIGLTSLDLTVPVPGLTAGTAPLDSAYTQWNSNPSPTAPLTDTALAQDNGAHDSVWQSVTAQEQIHAFLSPGGQVQSVCDAGMCTIP